MSFMARFTRLVLLVFVLHPSGVGAQEWTRYRGPNGTGAGEAGGIPVRWGDTDYDWKVDLPGAGHSEPVIWGEKVFLTSALDEGAVRLALCLRSQDGGTEWTARFPSSTHGKHRRNSHASSTPAADKDRIYCVFSTPAAYTVRALDHAGKEIWVRDLGPFVSQHSDGASPILFEDKLILPNEQDGKSFVAALDRATGRVVWNVGRRTEEVAYGTPCIHAPPGGRPEIILSSHAHGISSLDPATGATNWEALVYDKRTVSSPVLAGGLAIGTCGSGGGGNFLVAVKLGGKGDVTATHVAYKLTKSMPYVPTPLVMDDLLFCWGDGGVVSCVEAPTGKVLWQERVDGAFSGSPVRAGDRIYAMSEGGDVFVVAAKRTFELLARNPLGEGSHSTPAIAGGRIYFRTFGKLLAIGGGKPPADG
jgi:outer membrane protein assembly factor BamB